MRQLTPRALPSATESLSRVTLFAFLAIAFSGCSSITLDDVLGAPSVAAGDAVNDGRLDQQTVIRGLREALRVGSERSVARTSQVDGFLANELIRIGIPPEYEEAAETLRKVGLGRQVDRLEVGMNRAAEEAASEAREIFWDAIRSMTFSDAMGILRGHDTAATDYLQLRTEDSIRSRFRPIVVSKIDEVGLGRLYGQISESYNRLPFVTRQALDLNEYVTEEALRGLFCVLAEEEAKIRAEPLSRTTELLRRVFGGAR